MPIQLAALNELVDQASVVDLPRRAVAACQLWPIAKMMLPPSTSRHQLTAREEQELEETTVADLTERLWHSYSLPEQAEVLELLGRRLGPNARLQGPGDAPGVTLMLLLEEVYRRALALSLIHI